MKPDPHTPASQRDTQDSFVVEADDGAPQYNQRLDDEKTWPLAAPALQQGAAPAQVREHELKCWPSVFEGLLSGEKTFEIRLNDRDYRVGDVLFQREWVPGEGYTGREVRHRVGYVLDGGRFGLAEGHAAMSLASLAPTPEYVSGWLAGREWSVKSLLDNWLPAAAAELQSFLLPDEIPLAPPSAPPEGQPDPTIAAKWMEGDSTYFYFVDEQRWTHRAQMISGAQIRARIPGLDPSFMVYREGIRGREDTPVAPHASLELSEDVEEAPRLYTVPPATWGTLAPPVQQIEDGLLLLKALAMKVIWVEATDPSGVLLHFPDGDMFSLFDANRMPIVTPGLRAALIKATEANHA